MGFFSQDQQGGQAAATWQDAQAYVGATLLGTIVSTAIQEHTDLKTKAKTGKMQLRIVVQRDEGPNNYQDAKRPVTTLPDGAGEIVPDDGLRAVYVVEGSNLSRAVADALAQHSLDDVEIGAKLWLQYTGMAMGKNGEYKEYKASYQPAPQASGFQGFAQQQPQAPVQQPAAPPQQFAQPAAPPQQFAQQPPAPAAAPPVQATPPGWPQQPQAPVHQPQAAPAQVPPSAYPGEPPF